MSGAGVHVTDLMIEQAREHDEATAALYHDLDRVNARADFAAVMLMRLAGFQQRPMSGLGYRWVNRDGSQVTREDADAVLGKMDTHVRNLTIGCSIAEARAAERKITGERRAIQAGLREMNGRYTGWSRFFLVTSSAGHVHSSMHCSTCRPSTTYGWMPELSGKTEAEAVAKLGPALCSMCFPTAPVEHVGARISGAKAKKLAA